MRMDNETFRLKVENLFNSLRTDGGFDRGSRRAGAARSHAEKEPLFPQGRSRARRPRVQDHFYRLVLSRVRTDQEAGDIERHIRHMFYTDREQAKATLSRVPTRDVLPALFRVIALTEEGWLAGELIRIVLAAAPESSTEPLVDALNSKEYLLQCLAIYLIGKSGHDGHLHELARFYRRPFGEKIDRWRKRRWTRSSRAARALPTIC